MASTQILEGAYLSASPEQTMDANDAVLAARGDADSFMRLYHRHVRSVYRYLYARIGHHHDAEEATAVVFERAWSSLPRFQPTGPFAGWLFTIVRRSLADHYRRAAPQRANAAPLDAEIGDPGALPEDSVLRAEQRQALLAEVARLGPEHQEIICLRFFGELPYATIAAIVGKKEAAVKMTTYRALEVLKRRIDHE